MMRSVHANLLAAGLMVLAASPAFAQRQPGGPGPFGPPGAAPAPSADALLRNDKVQAELKLTDDQKADVQKAADKAREKYRDDFDKVRTSRDFQKMGELMKAQNEDVDKAVTAVLKPEQAKRLKQIEMQAAGMNAFSRDDVQEALKLTDAQKKEIKDSQKDLQDDVRDIMQDARGDRDKMAAAMKKVESVRAEAFDKLTAALSDDQKKTWKELTGDKFEVVLAPGAGAFGQPRGPGGFQRGQPGQVMPTFLQDALKLTDDQKKQMEDLQKEVTSKIDKILTDDQRKQLQEMRDGRGPGRDRPNPNP